MCVCVCVDMVKGVAKWSFCILRKANDELGSMPIAASLTEAATSLVLRGFLACSLVHFNVPQPCHRETNMSHSYTISLLHRWKKQQATDNIEHLVPFHMDVTGRMGAGRGTPSKKIQKGKRKQNSNKTRTTP